MSDNTEFRENLPFNSVSYSLYPPRRGKHKIFIGMAPGVGKTYRMLEEGHALKQEGIDVVVGLLETHGRKETAEKADGLEIVPRKQYPRGGLTLTDMDTDAILKRSPQLVLIDELAHTNVPGCPREKRYEDVEIVLAAGIDVYSTMNVQHLESLNDLVARITGVVVRERVPDRILDEADEVVVVDVTPETLQERLLEGKIYAPEKIQQSLDNFFQRRNLIALRELALREVADNVEEDAIATTPNGQFCNIHERVLVCVSTYPNSLQLLRRGARLANYMNAPLYTLFVADPERFLTKEESLHIHNCEKLCKEFEGSFIRVTSNNVANAIAETAEKYRITQIVIGESQRSRWQILLKGSLTQKLVRLLKNIDLHIIASEKMASPK
ncbi:MAG: universal stress protein [Nostoc sp. ZfuVER08]|jgi:two-component system sensor histidine kinase KdpD|uniref:Sensor histidine kinase KdpD n=1 Tax=Nostoc punctiforme FACHB-252 TaxID=1357509 RepID=A0ABR8H837_NOSPU|nr:universal stress protein [Nostoc punctiforme]MBD2611320.1 sensor histidine kinase KdpD [Nostoc punctiforme FACHB-252]MBL1199734.1 sensor histidine kinase KdpD [Nostoc sp. GBBB01]MDZ8015512.1 universal stress protein [Nostoc sp. ZfuVER08]